MLISWIRLLQFHHTEANHPGLRDPGPDLRVEDLAKGKELHVLNQEVWLVFYLCRRRLTKQFIRMLSGRNHRTVLMIRMVRPRMAFEVELV